METTTLPHLRLLKTEEAGKILRLTVRAMEERRRRGDGPPFVRLGATSVRYDVALLERWIADRTYSSTSEETAPDAA